MYRRSLSSSKTRWDQFRRLVNSVSVLPWDEGSEVLKPAGNGPAPMPLVRLLESEELVLPVRMPFSIGWVYSDAMASKPLSGCTEPMFIGTSSEKASIFMLLYIVGSSIAVSIAMPSIIDGPGWKPIDKAEGVEPNQRGRNSLALAQVA